MPWSDDGGFYYLIGKPKESNFAPLVLVAEAEESLKTVLAKGSLVNAKGSLVNAKGSLVDGGNDALGLVTGAPHRSVASVLLFVEGGALKAGGDSPGGGSSLPPLDIGIFAFGVAEPAPLGGLLIVILIFSPSFIVRSIRGFETSSKKAMFNASIVKSRK